MGKKWKHWNLTIFLKYKNLDYFLELFNLEFFVVIFFSFLKLTHVFIGLSVSDYKRQGFSLTFLQLDNLLSTYYVWGIMLCLLWVILWYLRNNHIPRVLLALLFDKWRIWSTMGSKISEPLMTTPNSEIRQCDSRTDVFTCGDPQQMYSSSTVPCTTYSHLWQKDLLWKSLNTPF